VSPVRKALVAVLALMIVVGLAGCTSDDVIAKVNGDEIKESEIQSQLDEIKAMYPDTFEGDDAEAIESEYRDRLIDNMISTILVRQDAEERGIEVSESEIEAYIDEIRASTTSEEEFQVLLDSVGMTFEDLEGEAESQLLAQKVIAEITADIDMTEAEVEAYYDENPEQFHVAAAKHPAHILLGLDDLETAESVLERVQGGEDFALLATEYSIDPGSAAQGGDLGWPSYPFVAEFQAALDELNTGDISELVESEFGWHIITVLEEREASDSPLEEVYEDIELILGQQKQADVFQRYLDDLRDAAEIEYPE